MTRNLPAFYPIIDTAVVSAAGLDPVEIARTLASTGVGIAQFRHKGDFTRDTYALAEEIGRILRAAGVRYVINDRADIALMLDAQGVHLGQEDLPPAAVRRFAADRLLVGYSTHNEQQLREGEREPVDYLALGPVFATGSKERPDPTVGPEELRRLRGMTGKPLVAIGGITRANAQHVFAAGVDAVAVISDWVAEDAAARVREWLEIAPGKLALS